MTGYGQAAAENESHRVAVSVRSVNHRFLDLALRMADDHRDFEADLRQLADGALSRGRVELRLAIETLDSGQAVVSIDKEAVGAVSEAFAGLDPGVVRDGALTASDLVRIPEVLRIERRSAALGAEDRALVLDVAQRALDQMVSMRQAEGARLATLLEERLVSLDRLVTLLAGEREQVRARLLETARARVAELLAGLDMPEERLAQETILLAEKTDVQEELDRLSAHLDHFRKAMASPKAIGRRLDFLAQEIHRELNTLGAKCRDSQMAEWVVDAKVACEQLREQVQNVE